MDENRKNDQVIQKLKAERLEQASEGNWTPSKRQYCDYCKDTTNWFYIKGVLTCERCGCGANGERPFV